jgi:hypothetical protein
LFVCATVLDRKPQQKVTRHSTQANLIFFISDMIFSFKLFRECSRAVTLDYSCTDSGPRKAKDIALKILECSKLDCVLLNECQASR